MTRWTPLVIRSSTRLWGKRSPQGPPALTIASALEFALPIAQVAVGPRPASVGRFARALEAAIILQHRAVPGGRTERVEHEPGIVRQTVEVADGPLESALRHARQQGGRGRDAERLAAAQVAAATEQIVELHADAAIATGARACRGTRERQRAAARQRGGAMACSTRFSKLASRTRPMRPWAR